MALTQAQQRQADRNRDYWQKREEEALKHYITDEKEYEKELKRIYKNMLDACQKEINAFYGRYADKEDITIATAKNRVKKADIEAYERKAERYVKTKDFSAKANEEMRLYNLMMKVNRLEMLKANIGLEMIAGHDELAKFMERILKGRTEEELARQAGILGKTVRNNAKMADAIVNASFHHATFSDRIWMYQDLLRDDLDKLLQSGLIQGKNPRVLAKELEKKFNATTTNAERLMRTELARVQTEAQKQSFEKNGFGKYMFIVNAGCCPICEEISKKDGGIYKVKDMMPGLNAPPVHPYCRCSTAAYEDTEEYEKWLAGLRGEETQKEVASSSKNDIIQSKYGFKKIKGEHTAFDDAKNSNPNYNKGDRNYHINCQRCCPAYELRRRGYDVEALPRKQKNDKAATGWMNIFKDAKWQRVGKSRGNTTKDAIVKTVSGYGNGARVEVYVQWKAGSAHVFMAEVIDGKVHFIDPQNGKDDVSYYFDYIKPTKTMICRLDNLEPTELIKECCK